MLTEEKCQKEKEALFAPGGEFLKEGDKPAFKKSEGLKI